MSLASAAGAFTVLEDHGALSVSGEERIAFLQNVLTSDVAAQAARGGGPTALLTPQGKILHQVFLAVVPDALLLVTPSSRLADLLRRLTLYKLRTKVAIADRSGELSVLAFWGAPLPTLAGASHCPAWPQDVGPCGLAIVPRHSAQGSIEHLTAAGWQGPDRTAFDAWRVAQGLAEADRDFALGDTFPHEANLDQTGAVSFDKGCYVGQEVVARMQHKTVVRKRVVRVEAKAALPTDRPEVLIGTVAIGRLGTVAGTHGLAMLRLDRAEEAGAKGEMLSAGGIPLSVAPGALEAYRRARAKREGSST